MNVSTANCWQRARCAGDRPCFRDEYNMIRPPQHDWISDPAEYRAELLCRQSSAPVRPQAGPFPPPELASVPQPQPSNNNNLLRLSWQVVQKRESGQLAPEISQSEMKELQSDGGSKRWNRRSRKAADHQRNWPRPRRAAPWKRALARKLRDESPLQSSLLGPRDALRRRLIPSGNPPQCWATNSSYYVLIVAFFYYKIELCNFCSTEIRPATS